jgi:hypothetical protein
MRERQRKKEKKEKKKEKREGYIYKKRKEESEREPASSTQIKGHHVYVPSRLWHYTSAENIPPPSSTQPCPRACLQSLVIILIRS